jgi:hypothetical protein
MNSAVLRRFLLKIAKKNEDLLILQFSADLHPKKFPDGEHHYSYPTNSRKQT